MTSLDEQLQGVDVAALLRAAVQSAVKQAEVKIKTPKQIAGTVEALNDEELDVLWVRADAEVMGEDPTQSMNFENPGVIPSVRLGEAFVGDQVRTVFDDAGASSQRTSALKEIVIPFGAEQGERIRIFEEDGKGYIAFFDEMENLVGIIDPIGIEFGDLTTPGRRVTMDPQGGIRMRSDNDHLVAIFDKNGLSFRDEDTGLVKAEITPGHFHLIDPVGTDSIEMVTQSSGTLSNPVYRSAVEANPGASLTAPAAPLFTTTPADDIEVAHVAAWRRAVSQAATMTPPGGHTERADENYDGQAAGTLQTSVATRDPATGATGDFTSSLTTWDHAVGTRVVVRGGGTTSPAFLSTSYAETATAGAVHTATISKPASVVDGTLLLTFVALGVNGGGVPTAWSTPKGFVFLGAAFNTSGSGTSKSTLAVGCWAKLAGASEPADYSTTINMPTGLKALSVHMVAISDPWLTPGGVQIRMAGKPIRRQIAFNELAAASTTLCDFQNISQAYDNLELVVDAVSDQNGATAGSVARYRIRFNNDTGANYFWQITDFQDANTTAQVAAVGAADSRLLAGVVNGLNGSTVSGIYQVLGYCRTGGRRAVHGSSYSTIGALGSSVRNGRIAGEYIGGIVNRIAVTMDGSPQRFGAGSRAYLYAY